MVTRGGESYTSQTDTNTWALHVLDSTPTVDRFEVRSGDRWASDVTSVERSELAGATKWPFSTDVWLSLAMRLPNGPANNPSSWMIAGQFHATPDDDDVQSSPILAQQFTGSTFDIITRSHANDPGTENPSGVSRYRETWTSSDWVRFVYRIRFERTGNGELQVWKDGVEIVATTAIPIGYNDAQGPYFKYGIYRSADASTTVVEFTNLEISTSSLLDRVANPLALPV